MRMIDNPTFSSRVVGMAYTATLFYLFFVPFDTQSMATNSLMSAPSSICAIFCFAACARLCQRTLMSASAPRSMTNSFLHAFQVNIWRDLAFTVEALILLIQSFIAYAALVVVRKPQAALARCSGALIATLSVLRFTFVTRRHCAYSANSAHSSNFALWTKTTIADYVLGIGHERSLPCKLSA